MSAITVCNVYRKYPRFCFKTSLLVTLKSPLASQDRVEILQDSLLAFRGSLAYLRYRFAGVDNHPGDNGHQYLDIHRPIDVWNREKEGPSDTLFESVVE